MHATQRDRLILELVATQGFVAFRDLESQFDASPATLRRDLERLSSGGLLRRVRGGIEQISSAEQPASGLSGVPFHENIGRHFEEKKAIGRAAAALCAQGEAVMIDGGSTTLQMCPHLAGLNLQVLTNSLHIVSALLPQEGTRILVPAGSVFREQNIILAASGEESMPRFHAPKLFMGAASLGPQGLMQADVILVAAERRLIDRAEQVIVLADSSKFSGSSGNVVCALSNIDTLISDSGLSQKDRTLVQKAGIKLLIV